MKPTSQEGEPVQPPQAAKAKHKPLRTLVVDIGGSGIKALVVNEIGEPMTERIRESTPRGGKADDVIKVIKSLAKKVGRFERVSVGFPGIVRSGVVTGAVNLASEWDHFHLSKALHEIFKKPV